MDDFSFYRTKFPQLWHILNCCRSSTVCPRRLADSRILYIQFSKHCKRRIYLAKNSWRVYSPYHFSDSGDY
ncbi:unnamed protein product [Blepharisma stoltei]|uniref:Uncharacterized protein n=1 Tax=Blepharisma stoltei TaxID=1481888 RepID=A0AAU9JU25_9CILI|nr:unnamed protein product [Blepharisma stoltei]